MSRPLCIEYAGAVYHATSRGNEKKPVFKDGTDRLNFLNTLLHVNKRYQLICHAHCLMTNHYDTIADAAEMQGYRQREVADHLGMYFTSMSRIVNATK